MVNTYSIKELSQLTRIKPHTLRIWEQRYNMMKPDRTCTNIRKYSQADLKYLLNVSILYDNGQKISTIAKLTDLELASEVRELSSKLISYPSQIQGLVLAMLDLDEHRFEKQISNNILSYGLEETMVRILFPFLQHIGILWSTNAISPVEEHFVSNLIRQKLIVAIDGLSGQLRPDSKKFILFLPEGELHEIGLLFATFLIKSKGHKVIYLGQSLPISDLAEIQVSQKADIIFTLITSAPAAEEVGPYLLRLKSVLPEAEIWVSGRQVVGQQLNCPENVIAFNSLEMLRNHINT